MSIEMLQVDTKGYCLLCQNTCDIPLEPGDSRQLAYSSGFKMLLRYLKVSITTFDEFSSLLRRNEVDEEGVKLLISLCTECTLAAEEFLKYFQEFERIRLELDRCCREVRDIIREGGVSTSRRNGGVVKEDISTRIAEKLRQETLDKCDRHLDSSIPKVLLKPKTGTKDLSENTNNKVVAKRKRQEDAAPCSSSHESEESPGSDEDYIPISTDKEASPWSLKKPAVRRRRLATNMKRDPKLTCRDCGYPFTNKSHLNRHLRNVHLKAPPVPAVLECEECDETFTKRIDLNQHIAEVHTASVSKLPFSRFKKNPKGNRNPNLECPHCKNLFIRGNHLRRHIQVVHSKQRPRCSVCRNTFPNKTYLNTHMIVKHPVSKFASELPPNTTAIEFRYASSSVYEDIMDRSKVEEKGESGPTRKCSLCQEEISTVRTSLANSFKFHVLEKHTDRIARDIEQRRKRRKSKSSEGEDALKTEIKEDSDFKFHLSPEESDSDHDDIDMKPFPRAIVKVEIEDDKSGLK